MVEAEGWTKLPLLDIANQLWLSRASRTKLPMHSQAWDSIELRQNKSVFRVQPKIFVLSRDDYIKRSKLMGRNFTGFQTDDDCIHKTENLTSAFKDMLYEM